MRSQCDAHHEQPAVRCCGDLPKTELRRRDTTHAHRICLLQDSAHNQCRLGNQHMQAVRASARVVPGHQAATALQIVITPTAERLEAERATA
jgi:hypothetical protein